ncbi:MAG: hypothetical protein M1269_08940 [Chloroflexi bacterium]|nr:hypothetical protein [Chloroflexota bacterium]
MPRLTPFRLFFISLALIFLEVSLTRTFSVLFFFYASFFAITLALLGCVSGSLYLYLFPWRVPVYDTDNQIKKASVMFAICVVLLVIFIPFSGTTLGEQAHGISPLYLVSFFLACIFGALPFFWAGLGTAVGLTRFPEKFPILLGYVLGGSAIGGALALPCLTVLGGVQCLMLAGFFGLIGAVPEKTSAKKSALYVFGLILILVFSIWNPWGLLHLPGTKSVNSRPIFSAWTTFSYVTAYDDVKWTREINSGMKDKLPPMPPQITVVMDLFAFTPIIRWERGTEFPEILDYEITSLPYYVYKNPSVFIMGAGGGKDILRAVRFGSKRIDGAEINPVITGPLMSYKFSEYSGSIYNYPGVNIATGDARRTLRLSKEKYDIIVSNSLLSGTSMASGAMNLTENHIYTVESIIEEIAHLKKDGMLAFSFWDPLDLTHSVRMTNLVRRAAEASGIKDFPGHVVIIQNADESTLDRFMLFLFKKSAFTTGQLDLLYEKSKKAGFKILWMPGRDWGPRVVSDVMMLKDSDESRNINALHDLSPTCDDRPFFFMTLKPWTIFLNPSEIDWAVNMSLITVILLFFMAAAFLILMLRLSRSKGRPAPGAGWILYFFLTGGAFLLMEVIFLQQFFPYITRPAAVFVIVLCGLLLSAGAGSLVLGMIVPEGSEPGRINGVYRWLLAVLILDLLFGGVSMAVTRDAGLVARIFTGLLIVLPAGFVMGMATPLGVRFLGYNERKTLAYLWAVNGGASVLFSVLGLLMMIYLGLKSTMILAVLLYAFAWLVLWLLSRRGN